MIVLVNAWGCEVLVKKFLEGLIHVLILNDIVVARYCRVMPVLVVHDGQ